MTTPLKPLRPTNKKLLAALPTACPQCGSHAVSWSPCRVWCTMCSFQTARKGQEIARDIILRWNAAVQHGDGWADLVLENNAREARLRAEKEARLLGTSLAF